MKCEIMSDGTLYIIPESKTEQTCAVQWLLKHEQASKDNGIVGRWTLAPITVDMGGVGASDIGKPFATGQSELEKLLLAIKEMVDRRDAAVLKGIALVGSGTAK